MALPTASLGQLPTMSMPYSIPTYDKGPSIWEKALASFLVNAAGGVAQQAAQNVMTRDSAPEFGEKGATGFGRLMGPKVGPDEAKQRRQNAYVAGESEKTRQHDSAQADYDRSTRINEAFKNRSFQEDQSRLDRESSAARSDRQNTLELTRQQQATLAREKEQTMGNTDARELARLKAMLENESPETSARTRLMGAQADKYGADAARSEWMRSGAMGGQTQGPTGAVATTGGAEPSVTPRASILARARGIPTAIPSTGEELPGTQPGRTIMDILNASAQTETPTNEPSMSFEPNTLMQVPTTTLQPDPSPPDTSGSNTRANEAVADWMRSVGYGMTNIVRPSNWRGDYNMSIYDPANGTLPAQLESRLAALSDQNSPTAMRLRKLLEFVNAQKSQ